MIPDIDDRFIDYSVSARMIAVIISTAVSGEENKFVQFLCEPFIIVFFLNFFIESGLRGNFFCIGEYVTSEQVRTGKISSGFALILRRCRAVCKTIHILQRIFQKQNPWLSWYLTILFCSPLCSLLWGLL